jgi:hypothetical protein
MKGAFHQKFLKYFQESDDAVKKIYGASALFIGVRGQFQENTSI